jgi:hypothetical protein
MINAMLFSSRRKDQRMSLLLQLWFSCLSFRNRNNWASSLHCKKNENAWSKSNPNNEQIVKAEFDLKIYSTNFTWKLTYETKAIYNYPAPFLISHPSLLLLCSYLSFYCLISQSPWHSLFWRLLFLPSLRHFSCVRF